MQVAFAADAVEITVENPAREGPLRAGGHGITGMRERAALLGGSVEAGALAGRFRLHARLPYRVAV